MGSENELIKAVQCGDEDTVQALIDAGTSTESSNGITPLFAALFDNKLSMVKLLLANKCDANARDCNGESPLCFTIRKQFNDCAKLLIDSDGCDLNQTDQPPFYMAVSQNNLEIMTWLLEAGCNVNQRGPDGYTALQKAIRMNNLEAVTSLLKCDQIKPDTMNDNGMNSLQYAAIFANIDIFKLILAQLQIQGNYDDCQKSVPIIDAQTKNRRKDTALHHAVRWEDIEKIRLLIEYGCDVNMQNADEQSPLFVAVDRHVDEEVVKLLLESGADPNCIALQAWTFRPVENCQLAPIHMAVGNGTLETVRRLTEAGAHLNVQDGRGQTPLFFALYHNKPDVAEYLLEKGIEKGLDVNIQDNGGNTAIFSAGRCGKPAKQLIEKLLELGCSMNHVNKSSITLLQHAVEKGFAEVVDVLLDNGADVNQFIDGQSLLQIAAGEWQEDHEGLTTIERIEKELSLFLDAKQRQTDLSRVLIDHGADIYLKSADGKSPFLMSLDHLSTGVSILLIHYGYNVGREDFHEVTKKFLPKDILARDGVIFPGLAELQDLILSVGKNPVSLKKQCRVAIRCFFAQQKLPKKSMCQLPLPKTLRDFMMLKDLVCYKFNLPEWCQKH